MRQAEEMPKVFEQLYPGHQFLLDEPRPVIAQIGMRVRYQGKRWTIIDKVPGIPGRLILTRNRWPRWKSVFAWAGNVQPV